MRSTIGIHVTAPADIVFRLARDIERWPTLLPHYIRVDVFRRDVDGSVTARMVARRELSSTLGLGIPVAWRARAWSEPESRRLLFRHLGGATGGMSVTWRIEPSGGGCDVSIEHDFRPRLGPWASVVDRLFVRPIAGRTLRTFKGIAEAVTEAGGGGRNGDAGVPPADPGTAGGAGTSGAAAPADRRR